MVILLIKKSYIYWYQFPRAILKNASHTLWFKTQKCIASRFWLSQACLCLWVGSSQYRASQLSFGICSILCSVSRPGCQVRAFHVWLQPSTGSSKKQESSRKTSTYVLLTMPKPLTVQIKTNCGKFVKRWKYQTALPAS